MFNDDEYLMHYGVLGMKWGIRKAETSSGSSNKGEPKKKKQSNRVKKAEKSKKSGNDKLERVKKKLDEIDKEKVKHIAKTTAVMAGKVAVAATLGSIGTLAIAEVQSGMKQYKAKQQEAERAANFHQWQKNVEKNQELIKTEILPDEPKKK